MEALFILCPDMRCDGAHIHVRCADSRGNDVFQRGVHQPQRPVGREQTQRTDVQVLRDLGGRGVDVRFHVGDYAAYDFRLLTLVRPCDYAREGARGGRVDSLLVESVRIADL